MSIIPLHKKEEAGEQSWLVNNIKRLMMAKGLNEAKLAKRTNIPQPTLHKILSGKTEDPRVSTLKLLAEFFNVSLDAIIYTPPHEQFNLSSSGTKKQTKHIPILSWQQCTDATNFLTTLTSNNWEHWETATVSTEQAIAIVSKACMEPYFTKGTILLVDLTDKPIDGDLVIVHYADTDEATLRQLSLDGPIKRLKALNSEQVDTLDDSIKIVGTVTQSKFNYHNK